MKNILGLIRNSGLAPGNWLLIIGVLVFALARGFQALLYHS